MLVVGLVLPFGAAIAAPVASASRLPRPYERAAITQELTSFFWRKHRAEIVAIRSVRVTTVVPPGGWNPKALYYMRDATVATVHATKRGEPQQVVQVLLGRYVAPISRWTILGYGGTEVGCDLPLSTFGRQEHYRILQDLKLPCP